MVYGQNRPYILDNKEVQVYGYYTFLDIDKNTKADFYRSKQVILHYEDREVKARKGECENEKATYNNFYIYFFYSRMYFREGNGLKSEH